MKLARVVGNAVASRQHPCYRGHKVLLLQPVDERGQDAGPVILGCDTVNAGPGDLVLVEQEGNSARELLGTRDDPFHSVVVGIVDRVDIQEE